MDSGCAAEPPGSRSKSRSRALCNLLAARRAARRSTRGRGFLGMSARAQDSRSRPAGLQDTLGSMHERNLKVSQSRLWSLVEERCQPGADVARIDQRICDLFGEEWAVMFTDLSGFSRRVQEFGIIHFLQIIHEQHKILLPIVEKHDGLLIKEEGDSLLILFRRPERALECSIAMQRACRQVNERRKPEEHILLCVGLGFGKILRIADEDAWG